MATRGTPITDELRKALDENPDNIDAIVTAIEKVEQVAHKAEGALGEALRGVRML